MTIKSMGKSSTPEAFMMVDLTNYKQIEANTVLQIENETGTIIIHDYSYVTI